MTSQRAGGVQWRATTVLIRADIFTSAQEQGIDISSECNRALADRLGIDYSQQQIPETLPVKPVIIAREPSGSAAGSAGTGKSKQLRPVLNAEDPKAPAHVLKMRAEPVPAAEKPPAATPAGKGQEQQETTIPRERPDARRTGGKEVKKGPQKKSRDDLIRKFLAKKIVRTESGDAEVSRIAKDEMYQLFVRFCRANPGGTVMDKRSFTVAMKNRFVMEDATADGTSYWIQVKLR